MKTITSSTVYCLLLSCLLGGCAVATDEERPLPADCSVSAEYIRVQLCPKQPVLVLCTDPAQTNPEPAHCDGPDWTEGHQTTGNAWCCDAALESRRTQQAPKPPAACAAFGEAPDVTTIRTPVTADAPHPDCVLLEERSAAGQNQYCCMGAAFDAWYSGIRGSEP